MLILEFSPWNAQVDNSEQIPRYKFSGNPGSNHVLVGLQPSALPLCQVYLCFVTQQSGLFLLVYTCMVSVFFFDVAMLFFAFLLGMVSERLQIVSPREKFFQNKLCKLFDGDQLLLSVVKLILHSSTVAHLIASERFLQFTVWCTCGCEPGTSRTAAECSIT